jgi:hypothetical protein
MDSGAVAGPGLEPGTFLGGDIDGVGDIVCIPDDEDLTGEDTGEDEGNGDADIGGDFGVDAGAGACIGIDAGVGTEIVGLTGEEGVPDDTIDLIGRLGDAAILGLESLKVAVSGEPYTSHISVTSGSSAKVGVGFGVVVSLQLLLPVLL